MLEVIQKLLILQDRDLQILKVKEELTHIPPERQQLQARASTAQTRQEDIRSRLNHLESERKRLELEADGKKELIEKYSLQQFQTKKNEEYRALANEIDSCRETIRRLEDQQLDFMEQAEKLQKEAATAANHYAETKSNVVKWLAELAEREQTLQSELCQLEATRNELSSAVDHSPLLRYERLFKHRGRNVVVGIQHGVCGGCHMRLSRQTLVSCRAEQEIITCINCGRILYYTPDMDLAVAE